MPRHRLFAACLAFLLPLAAHARPALTTLPPEPGAAKPNGLTGRVVRYDGGTNGQMVVAIHNPTSQAQVFDAGGLYFVPRLDPQVSPQRLGAVGGFDIAEGPKRGTRQERLTLPPGQSAELRLDVYCIDSHRPSPDPSTPFRIANERMPRRLVEEIGEATKRAADANGGYAAPAAKSAVQGEVWKNRDKQWVPLEGEGAQERGK